MHPDVFNIMSSISNTPTFKTNCRASMTVMIKAENTAALIIFLNLLNINVVKKPSGINVTILAARLINTVWKPYCLLVTK
jgi:hypothetical protein